MSTALPGGVGVEPARASMLAGRALPKPAPLFRKLDDNELAGLLGRLNPAAGETG